MDRLGPWDGARRVAVAVSGGADSLALALLSQAWGDPVAFIVDHGLRRKSAAEAEATRAALAARGIPATILRLAGLAAGRACRPGPVPRGMQPCPRRAASAGLVDLLLGHHAGDQAETVLMRQRRGSGPDGLAGMAALVETDDFRLLRPLLPSTPRACGPWSRPPAWRRSRTPPTSTARRPARGCARRSARTGRPAGDGGGGRPHPQDAEATTAADLAARAQLYPEGFAVLPPGPIRPESLAALLRSLSGRRFPVGHLASLARSPRPATLAGVQVLPAGRLGPGWLLVREAAALERPGGGPARGGLGRPLPRGGSRPGSMVGAVGEAASGLRHASHLPAAVLRTLPALRYNTALSDVPHLTIMRRGMR